MTINTEFDNDDTIWYVDSSTREPVTGIVQEIDITALPDVDPVIIYKVPSPTVDGLIILVNEVNAFISQAALAASFEPEV